MMGSLAVIRAPPAFNKSKYLMLSRGSKLKTISAEESKIISDAIELSDRRTKALMLPPL